MEASWNQDWKGEDEESQLLSVVLQNKTIPMLEMVMIV